MCIDRQFFASAPSLSTQTLLFAMSEIARRIEAAKAEVASLKDQINKARSAKKDKTMRGSVSKTLPMIRGPPATKVRRMLKGHFGKVMALHWASDSNALVSSSLDGKLLVWNTLTTNKLHVIPLKSTYVMCVAMEPTKGQMVASGGLDNLCTIHNLNQGDPEKTAVELASHDGFLASCRFLNEQQILTGSGDSMVILWDIPTQRPVEIFAEHKEDVIALAVNPKNSNVFVSASVDRTTKVWDIRTPKGAVQTFTGHEGDINGVDFMSNGLAFGTGSEDGTARVFDLRAYNEVCKFGKVQADGEGLTSVSFSRSGRILFGGHADSNVLAWDTLGDKASPTFTFNQAHDQHVSCIGVNPKGDALCTGSWDATLKIWA